MTDDRAAGEPRSGSVDGGALASRERAELARLRREVAELRARVAPGGGPGPRAGDRPGAARSRPHVRWSLALALVALASLLAPVAVAARYARAELLDTDRYVDTVAPLARDPAVRAALTDQVTTIVFDHLDVEGVARDALQGLADRGAPAVVVGLASPIADQVRGFTHDQVAQLVATEQFAELWERANRAAHERVDAVLTGDTDGAVDVADGRVSVDLGEIVARVKQRLLDRGFELAERIPDVDARFTLLESRSLERTQVAVRWLDRAATALPFAVLAIVAAAVAVAPDRRRGLLAAAVGVTLGMVVLAAALALLRAWYLDNGTPRAMPPDTAVSIARTVLVPLRTALRAVLALGLVVAAAAFLAGPSAVARAVRRGPTRAIAAVRDRVAGERQPSAAETWVAAHKTGLQLAAAAAGALVFALWTYPSARVVAAIVVGVVVTLAVIELAGREAPGDPGRAGG